MEIIYIDIGWCRYSWQTGRSNIGKTGEIESIFQLQKRKVIVATAPIIGMINYPEIILQDCYATA